jgi:hypothetical protein
MKAGDPKRGGRRGGLRVLNPKPPSSAQRMPGAARSSVRWCGARWSSCPLGSQSLASGVQPCGSALSSRARASLTFGGCAGQPTLPPPPTPAARSGTHNLRSPRRTRRNASARYQGAGSRTQPPCAGRAPLRRRSSSVPALRISSAYDATVMAQRGATADGADDYPSVHGVLSEIEPEWTPCKADAHFASSWSERHANSSSRCGEHR